MTESELLRAVKELLVLYKWHYIHIADARRTDSKGFPDLFCVREQPIEGKTNVRAFECKTEKGRVSIEQEQWIISLICAGIPAMVIRPSYLESLKEILS